MPASSHNSKDKDKNRAKDNNKDREKDKEKYVWFPRVFGPPIVSHNNKDKEYKTKTNIITRKMIFKGKGKLCDVKKTALLLVKVSRKKRRLLIVQV